MQLFVVLVLSLVPYQSHAIGASNGFIPHPQGKVTAQEQRAIIQSLDSDKVECIYGNLGDRMFSKEWDPEIFDAPDPCARKNTKTPQPQRALCVGTVICHTPNLKFVVEKAICWARDGQHCPPPSKCVQQSFIKSFETVKGLIVQMPVYETTEPARSAK